MKGNIGNLNSVSINSFQIQQNQKKYWGLTPIFKKLQDINSTVF